MDSGEKVAKEKSTKQRRSLCAWMQTPSFYIYCTYFLSAWGDWKWQFSVGLYLVHLADKELRLAAIFGFSAAGSVLLLGGLIGNWVDKTGRLTVVRVSLFVQNMSVMLCALCVCFTLEMSDRFALLLDGGVIVLCEAAIIILAVIAQLASVAYKIAIEKDWIVVVAAGNRSKLADLNAMTRAIDLMCKIMSPAVAGLIIYFGSLTIGAAVIAAWNFFSVFVEYALLWKVYQIVPELSRKKPRNADVVKELEMQDLAEKEPLRQDGDGDVAAVVTNGQTSPTSPTSTEKPGQDGAEKTADQKDDATKSVVETIFAPFITIGRGWRIYARQRVVFAGVALAFLYMTVLGFDSITIGYIYANGVNSGMVGLSMSLAGVTGIFGTLAFTWMRRRIGLERTGLFGFNAEVVCLVLCVASIWTTGSVFAPAQAYRIADDDAANCSSLANATANATAAAAAGGGGACDSDGTTGGSVNVSIILFLVGVITSRVGLWMSDLVVTQLLQESVREQERGIVNGVQNSLNMLMDLLKFSLVIVLPQIDTYGYLIILSFIFICFASLLFAFHSRRVRGHLFHFMSLCPASSSSAAQVASPIHVISVLKVDKDKDKAAI